MEVIVLVILGLVAWAVWRAVSRPSTPPQDVFRNPSTITRSIVASQDSQSSIATATWNPPRKVVEIRGFQIADGMIYTGSNLTAVNGHGIDPALINPKLKLSEPSAGYRGEDMSYWPSYSDISPQARWLYLQWLAGGRINRDVSIGIVFLFFYGLERRLLVDRGSSDDAEQLQLLTEIDRLLGIYGDSRSFRSYAGTLREVVALSAGSSALNTPPPPSASEISLKVGLGHYAAKSEPLPADWAFYWVTNDLQYSPRTSAERCPEEFNQLFTMKYVEKYSPGIKLKKGRKSVAIDYRPASSSFQGATVKIKVESLPDVSGTSEPIGSLRLMASECLDELDGYSRFIGRNPEQRNAPAAIALLPQRLVNARSENWIPIMTSWLKGQTEGKESALLPFQELVSRWPEIKQERYGKRDWISLALCLEKMGYGIEPDVRFSSLAPDPMGLLSVFRLPQQLPTAPNASYNTAALLMHLAATVAGSDGKIAPEEKKLLETHLSVAFDLSDGEQARLRAHTCWLLAALPNSTGIKKRVETLSSAQKVSVAKFLVTVASVDGQISPSEMSSLTRLYRLLNLDEKSLYSDAHTASSTPIVAQVIETPAQGYAIPADDIRKPRNSGVDMAKVANLAAESERVSKLLEGIFATEDEPYPSVKSPDPVGDTILGLDAAQTAFIRTTISKTVWSRSELEELADEHGILLDGTIEAINDAAIDVCNELLLEGDSQVELNTLALRELKL
jgi:tellurite resistance protein